MHVIVVGGSGSKVGKTTLVCLLIAQARKRGRVVALKVSTHMRRRRHELSTFAYAPRNIAFHDTDRYLAAGANVALLLEAGSERFRSHLAVGLRRARRLRPDTLIIESTTAGALLVVEHESWFVAASTPWKPRAEQHFSRAQRIVQPHELACISMLGENTLQIATLNEPTSGSPSHSFAL